MLLKCKKCQSTKHKKSFVRINKGLKKDQYSRVCYQCRYGDKKNIKITKPAIDIETQKSYYSALIDRKSVKSDNCWEWTGTKNKWGYGEAYLNGKHVNAQRAAWFAYNGEIPAGLYVLHKCDNRGCVNPDHLFLGTPQDNMNDMIRKGRANILRGDKCPWARTNEKDVVSIIEDLKRNIPTKDIAVKYNVSLGQISDIKRGYRWNHIGDRTGLIVIAPNRHLDEAKVKEIKKRLKNRDRVRYIAKDYEIHENSIADIKHGRSWKHVTIEDSPE